MTKCPNLSYDYKNAQIYQSSKGVYYFYLGFKQKTVWFLKKTSKINNLVKLKSPGLIYNYVKKIFFS